MSNFTQSTEQKFVRNNFYLLIKRLHEQKKFIQILTGPRQTGKTTLIQQVITETNQPSHYASADEPSLHGQIWIEQQWETGRLCAKNSPNGALLVLDEIQKITAWPETVKRLWGEDIRNNMNLKVVLLGSSPLLIQRGLTESLAGRFELIPMTHWSLDEMQEAFGWSVEQYVFFGGYPGATPLIEDQLRWKNYIRESLIETTISRDILLMEPVKKPALLRRLFLLSCDYSSQILSYQKMLGQLQDAGNTTTLAHYLELLKGAGMVAGIQKFSGSKTRQRSSSPKLQVLNTALISAQSNLSLAEALFQREYWGRLIESSIGAHLLNNTRGKNIKVFYWREQNREVDFVLQQNNTLIAIEVKSGTKPTALNGMQKFHDLFKPKKSLLVGGQGISIAEFLRTPVENWFL